MTPVRRIVRFVPAALVYSFIFYLSSRTEFPIEAPFPWFDKIAHFAEFAALGACLAYGAARPGKDPGPRRRFRTRLGLWAAGTGLGLLDEVHQIFVPGRNPDPADGLTDALGVAVGLGLYLVLRRRRAGL